MGCKYELNLNSAVMQLYKKNNSDIIQVSLVFIQFSSITVKFIIYKTSSILTVARSLNSIIERIDIPSKNIHFQYEWVNDNRNVICVI